MFVGAIRSLRSWLSFDGLICVFSFFRVLAHPLLVMWRVFVCFGFCAVLCVLSNVWCLGKFCFFGFFGGVHCYLGTFICV